MTIDVGIGGVLGAIELTPVAPIGRLIDWICTSSYKSLPLNKQKTAYVYKILPELRHAADRGDQRH